MKYVKKRTHPEYIGPSSAACGDDTTSAESVQEVSRQFDGVSKVILEDRYGLLRIAWLHPASIWDVSICPGNTVFVSYLHIFT